jgi:hypothetical protein
MVMVVVSATASSSRGDNDAMPMRIVYIVENNHAGGSVV